MSDELKEALNKIIEAKEALNKIIESKDEQCISDYVCACQRSGQYRAGALVGSVLKDKWLSMSKEFLDSISICLFYVGHTLEAMHLITYALETRNYDTSVRARLNFNRFFSIRLMKDAYRDSLKREVVQNVQKFPRDKNGIPFILRVTHSAERALDTLRSFLKCCDDVDTGISS